MTEGEKTSGPARYWPTLDGVRAVAIIAVIAYHLGDFGGGWLGVDVFFVLSGYLITSLLLAERRRRGGVNLPAFWARRARRLLPAVLLLLTAVAVYAWLGGPGIVPAQLRSPALATLFYGANWQQIVSGHGYFAQFLAPNPLLHTWSLAIEEQYYLCWPLVFIALTALTRGSRRRLAVAIGVLAVASATWMGIAAHVFGANRAYLGTDTRAWELLLGGLAAVLWEPGVATDPATGRRWSAVAAVAVVGAAVGAAFASGPPAWIWDGGAVAIAACVTLTIVGSVRAPRGLVGRVLSLAPMRWLGRVSYSLYLWHWPIIVVFTTSSTGLSGPALLGGRLLAMTGAACVSYYAVERPLRQADWSSWRRRALVPVTFAGLAGVVLAATVTPTQAATAPVAVHVVAPPVTVPPIVVASPAQPLRVWILGDSVMYDASLGIGAALAATGEASVVANSSFGGWGLSTDHVWPSDEEMIVGHYQPDVVIGTWSWDDPLAAADPVAYAARLHQALADILTPGNGVKLVVLLQFPQTGPAMRVMDPAKRAAAYATQTAQQDLWDSIAKSAVTAFPGHAMYLTTDQLFAPGGRFMVWLKTLDGTWIRARKIDDTHLCPFGAASLGALVVGDLTPALALGPLAPGWQAGPWIKDPRYNDPPGACPNDQPPPGYTGIPVP
jgi:peptidoglycan/LPS O-acetylase OafA/YrhL